MRQIHHKMWQINHKMWQIYHRMWQIYHRMRQIRHKMNKLCWQCVFSNKKNWKTRTTYRRMILKPKNNSTGSRATNSFWYSVSKKADLNFSFKMKQILHCSKKIWKGDSISKRIIKKKIFWTRNAEVEWSF